MANKTKADLTAEIATLKEQIKIQEGVEKWDKATREVREAYNSFVRSGFTEEQAWEILKIQLSSVSRPKPLFG